METTVEKLEAMFLKSQADLEYIEKRLKLDFINNTKENGVPAEVENPAVMLENLKAIKSKHAALCSQVKEIAAAQKESMDSIRNNLSSVMDLMNNFQETTDVEFEPATESDLQSAEFLGLNLSKTTIECERKTIREAGRVMEVEKLLQQDIKAAPPGAEPDNQQPTTAPSLNRR